MSATIYPPLTAYRIHHDDGTSYRTSMAAGVTLEQARAHFIGLTDSDDTEEIRFIRRTVIAVTACAATPHSRIEREIALAQSERTARSIHRQACELHRLNTPPKEGDIINDPQSVWHGAEVISVYTRAQAVEDGALVDVSETASEAGIKFPVAVTAAVWADCCEWTEADEKKKGGYGQSERGRLWDVISMLRFAISAGKQGDHLLYKVSRIPRPGYGTKRLVTLKAICGPGDRPEPVITIMQPNES